MFNQSLHSQKLNLVAIDETLVHLLYALNGCGVEL